MLKIDDLPTGPEDMEQDAENFFVDVESMTNAILVLGQLDPIEVVENQPRWTPEQQKIIVNAQETLKSWDD